MKLHHKLMVVLALFGLLPTVAVGWLGRDAIHRIEANLSERGREIIRARLTERLTAAMIQAAALVDHQRAVVELGLRVQVAEAEARLNAPADAVAPPLGPAPLLPVMTGENGGEDGADTAARLSTLAGTFRTVHATLPEAFLWQYVTMADGTMLAYPPQYAYPAGQDPRKSVWYTQAIEAGDVVWATPGLDIVTGQLVLTAAAPVRASDGTVIGVSGIDVSVLAGMDRLRERANLPTGMTALLVQSAQDAADTPALSVVARAEPQTQPDGDKAWRLPAGPELVTSSDTAALGALASNIAAGGSGVARLPYGGVDSLWAYGSLETYGGALVFVVPFSRIEAMSTGISDVVGEATRHQLTATGGAALGILGLALLGAWAGARTVSQPLIGLREAVDRVASGDMEARAPVGPAGSRDELGILAQRFNAMVPLLQDRLTIRRALSVAQEVQQALLPQKSPDLPGFDIAGRSLYCDETGGDYFDY
ncbi:MAG: HAMP domain-containing protein, partial [Rhodospirillaceae bacterium]